MYRRIRQVNDYLSIVAKLNCGPRSPEDCTLEILLSPERFNLIDRLNAYEKCYEDRVSP